MERYHRQIGQTVVSWAQTDRNKTQFEDECNDHMKPITCIRQLLHVKKAKWANKRLKSNGSVSFTSTFSFPKRFYPQNKWSCLPLNSWKAKENQLTTRDLPLRGTWMLQHDCIQRLGTVRWWSFWLRKTVLLFLDYRTHQTCLVVVPKITLPTPFKILSFHDEKPVQN